jgi:predicted RNA-binding Zn-ribbon protein involved in translation (DUF1610 family)
MPLSMKLTDVMMAFPCPNCGHDAKRKGSSWLCASKFRCVKCQKASPITYDDKLQMFAKHEPSHLPRVSSPVSWCGQPLISQSDDHPAG